MVNRAESKTALSTGKQTIDKSSTPSSKQGVSAVDHAAARVPRIRHLIESSNSQSLESNLNRALGELTSDEERIVDLAESILDFDNTNQAETNLGSKIAESEERMDKSKRCIIDLLLDFFCHLDAHIVNKQFTAEIRLLFELRQQLTSTNKLLPSAEASQNMTVTQPFLLALFVHQASWRKLYACVEFLLRPKLDQVTQESHSLQRVALNRPIHETGNQELGSK